jgi:hypothetical protein
MRLNTVDSLGAPVHEADVLDEVEVTTGLIIAANECDDESLSQTEIDRLLGL